MKSEKNFFLVKTEPNDYSLERFVTDKTTAWTGVRNYLARKHLTEMQLGDECFFYRSMVKPAILARCEVIRTAYPDTESWVAVDLALKEIFPRELSLQEIKRYPQLSAMQLVRNSRLSVQKVTAEEFRFILNLLHPPA